MKLIFFLSVILFCPAVHAQNSNRINPSDFRTWDFGSSIGFTYPRTDISGEGGNLGISFDLSKFVSPHFALQFRFLHATISGQDINQPNYIYNTTINYDLTINAKFQTSNLVLLSPEVQNRFGLYATIGIGVITYSPDIWLDGGFFKMHGIYSQYSNEYDTFDYRGSTDFVLPIAIGAAYRISDRTSLSAEYTYRITNTDKLDGFFKLLSANDSYSFLNFGVIFHLGKKEKVLEWENSLSDLYKDVDNLKAKLAVQTRDSDSDGVPDINDKEPATPAGTKVYGDGTSVDSDSDGVPDRIDLEPFSAPRVKVDANGREVRPVKQVEPPKPVVEEAKPVEPSELSIFFGYDNSKISRDHKEVFRKIAQQIQNDRTKKYRVIAICDDKSKVYNVNLSQRRADNVKAHLVKYYNINSDRLVTEVEFVTLVAGDEKKNRRVDVKAIPN